MSDSSASQPERGAKRRAPSPPEMAECAAKRPRRLAIDPTTATSSSNSTADEGTPIGGIGGVVTSIAPSMLTSGAPASAADSDASLEAFRCGSCGYEELTRERMRACRRVPPIGEDCVTMIIGSGVTRVCSNMICNACIISGDWRRYLCDRCLRDFEGAAMRRISRLVERNDEDTEDANAIRQRIDRRSAMIARIRSVLSSKIN